MANTGSNPSGMPGSNPWPSIGGSTSSFGNPSTFTAAANTNGSDYDAIMKQYQDFINNNSSNSNGALTNKSINTSSISPGSPITSSPINSSSPITSGAISRPGSVGFSPLTAKTSNYTQSQDVTNSLSSLKDLTDTGGYSPQGIQDIRERNISPIRSIYASGKQGLERNRALSGGYSPSFNATSASMARDQASKISDVTTRTNADIAQNVATNRLSAASPYASASANANAAKTASDARNTDIINQINEYNANQKGNIDEFNTTTGLGVDKYNRDTQIGVDTSNRDSRLATDKYNRDTQLGVDKSNRDTQLGVDTANRDAKLNIDKLNADNLFRTSQTNQGNILDAIKAKTSLYGTTPALTNTFGNQVVQAGQLSQGQQDINARKQNAILQASRG